MKNYRDSAAVFATVPGPNIQRSVFQRNIDYKTTLNAGYLVPFYFDEVLPGDTIMLNSLSIFARATTLAVPVMDNIYFDWFFFFVPNRLVWKHWKAMQGEKVALDSSTDYVVPVVKPPLDGNGWPVESLADYLGCRIGVSADLNALPFRAYNLIYDEWFRDENLCPATNMANEASYGDGPDAAADYVVRKSGKRHDIFTSCLPWPQKPLGNMSAVVLPLGSEAPVVSNGKATAFTDGQYAFWAGRYYDQPYFAAGSANPLDGDALGSQLTPNPGTAGVFSRLGFYDQFTGLKADLSTATAALWTTVRNAAQFQKILERQARGGTRYAEILRTAFGVQPADARLQRPEFLANGSTMVKISAVAQTSETSTSPQAHLAAYATVSDTSRGVVYSATEHGMIFGLCRVRADLNYQQGTPKFFFKSTFYDFYRPELACISEQPVYQREIFTTGTSADTTVFGYQEAWYEYRYNMPMITGKLRSDAANSLDVWHLAQDFANAPSLNQTFIEEDVPMSRVKAVTSEPDFKVDFKGIAKWVRPMPVYSVPGLVDHF